MKNIRHFPLANDYSCANGWTLDVNFLKSVQRVTSLHSDDVSLERIEAILIAAEICIASKPVVIEC